MRLLLIGQAPSQETVGQPPFTGKCGSFLAGLMSLTQEQMLAQHDFLNVLNYWPGKGIGGDKFPITEAIKSAKEMLPKMRGRTVVLLGANVARAFGARGFRYCEYYEIRNPDKLSDVVVPQMSVVPHPSGVNRWYNRQDSRDQVRKFFSSLVAKNP